MSALILSAVVFAVLVYGAVSMSYDRRVERLRVKYLARFAWGHWPLWAYLEAHRFIHQPRSWGETPMDRVEREEAELERIQRILDNGRVDADGCPVATNLPRWEGAE